MVFHYLGDNHELIHIRMKTKYKEDILRHHVDHHAYQSPVNKYF